MTYYRDRYSSDPEWRRRRLDATKAWRQRLVEAGLTTKGTAPKRPVRNGVASAAMRVLDRVLIGDGCWEFTGSLNNRGYGQVREAGAGSRLLLTHRVVYEALVGPIADGMTIDHLCRNTKCANPDHMEQVTNAENSRRARAAA